MVTSQEDVMRLSLINMVIFSRPKCCQNYQEANNPRGYSGNIAFASASEGSHRRFEYQISRGVTIVCRLPHSKDAGKFDICSIPHKPVLIPASFTVIVADLNPTSKKAHNESDD